MHHLLDRFLLYLTRVNFVQQKKIQMLPFHFAIPFFRNEEMETINIVRSMNERYERYGRVRDDPFKLVLLPKSREIPNSLLPSGSKSMEILPRRGLRYVPSVFCLTNLFLLRLQQAFVLGWNEVDWEWKIQWLCDSNDLILRPIRIEHSSLLIFMRTPDSCFVEKGGVWFELTKDRPFIDGPRDKQIATQLEPLLLKLHVRFYRSLLLCSLPCLAVELVMLIIHYL